MVIRRDSNVAEPPEPGDPRPLALELIAFLAGVLRCDQPGCDLAAHWSTPQGVEPAEHRCAAHRSPATTVAGVHLPSPRPPAPREDRR